MSRATDAHDIILYYNEFARGETTRLEALRKEGKEGRAKVAVIARRLLTVAREIEGVDGSEVTKATIEKYAERFEKDMLRLFEKAYLKGEPKAMAVELFHTKLPQLSAFMHSVSDEFDHHHLCSLIALCSNPA